MQKKLPKISIITPSLNQGRYIKRTIDSVISQNYPDIELIVVDGGSTDETLDILKAYGKKISWTSKKDTGQSNAINKGLWKAHGDIVGYLNSDDILMPGSLEAVASAFAENQDWYWITGRCDIIDELDKPVRSLVTAYKNLWLSFPSHQALCILNYISQPATFWRREAGDTIGKFNENLSYAMDYEYWLRFYKKYPLHVLGKTLAAFRVHRESKGFTQFSKQLKEGNHIAFVHTPSRILRLFHRFHDILVTTVYNILT